MLQHKMLASYQHIIIPFQLQNSDTVISSYLFGIEGSWDDVLGNSPPGTEGFTWRPRAGLGRIGAASAGGCSAGSSGGKGSGRAPTSSDRRGQQLQKAALKNAVRISQLGHVSVLPGLRWARSFSYSWSPLEGRESRFSGFVATSRDN